MTDPRRNLPSVDRLLADPGVQALIGRHPRSLVLRAVREQLEAARDGRAGPPAEWAAEIADRCDRYSQPSLRPVLNATGVVLHTNLGRAPLADAALAAMSAVATGYSTLEFDLASGSRGHRSDHARHLLAELTGAADGLVVNNAAAALVLALGTAAAGKSVLISRGELIEIGGSFRIPDILATSGARLAEVGTTNRTHLEDYRRALDGAGAILTVHRSNFEQRGFVTSPRAEELAALARQAGIPYLHDVGSGLLLDLAPYGLSGEPLVRDAVAAGADLVLFSGDKLLGGPQAGCLVGNAAWVERCRKAPFARAVRADRFTLAAMEATLTLYRDPAVALREVPVLRMLTLDGGTLARRAASLSAALSRILPADRPATVMAGQSAVGGGALPGAILPTSLVVIDAGSMGPDGLALRLRTGEQPVVARVGGNRLLLDPRTLPDGSDQAVAAALAGALQD
ncbi:MAG TPA: L-seryl-tRNA(Sec) selenium transferase [Gemmatimonadales bacterium]|nr:L-seryl-tRNA(Sec) selenium transferase [Gemmatimonadales bacterium]